MIKKSRGPMIQQLKTERQLKKSRKPEVVLKIKTGCYGCINICKFQETSVGLILNYLRVFTNMWSENNQDFMIICIDDDSCLVIWCEI